MDRLTIEKLDPDLKRKFRVWCLSHGTTMREVLTDFIAKTVAEEETARKKGRPKA